MGGCLLAFASGPCGMEARSRHQWGNRKAHLLTPEGLSSSAWYSLNWKPLFHASHQTFYRYLRWEDKTYPWHARMRARARAQISWLDWTASSCNIISQTCCQTRSSGVIAHSVSIISIVLLNQNPPSASVTLICHWGTEAATSNTEWVWGTPNRSSFAKTDGDQWAVL